MAEQPTSPFAGLDTSLLRSTQPRPERANDPDDSSEQLHSPAPDRWLPLRDAAHELALPEVAIYRLIGDGKLRSRTVHDNQIQVWVRHADRPVHVPQQPVEVIERERS